MKRALIIFVCIIVICACSDKEYIQRFADIKYKGVDMEVKEFRIDGFYVESNKLEIDLPFSYIIVCILFTIVMIIITVINAIIYFVLKCCVKLTEDICR